jgi:saccharopine dehydrogenase-like NADP-dependent oxidoreductase
MKNLAVLGLGHIGSYVLDTLSKNKTDFGQVNGYDLTTGHDLSDEQVLTDILSKHDGALVSTPFFLNKKIAEVCDRVGCDYFDLTESVEVTNYVKQLSNARYVTQCGLAPGMVSIIANHLAGQFDRVNNIEIKVGALPVDANNHIGYYRTWSTEGLINEYIHPCPALRAGKLTHLEPLTLLADITVQNHALEAATTSGGLGSLAESYQGRANDVTYKTLRFPGHWKIMSFLKENLGLKDNFETYIKLFNENVPQTVNDQVIILIDVDGYIGNKFITKQYSKIVKSTEEMTAIQNTTGSGVMCVLDSWAKGNLDSKTGWIAQEELDYTSIWNSQYSDCYK